VSEYRTADGLPGLTLAEWQSGTLPGVGMTQRDLRLAERLGAFPQAARLDIRWSGDGVAVSATGAAGVFRFSSFEVRVEPKFVGDHLQLFRLIGFATGIEGLSQLAGSPAVRLGQPDLLDFIIEVLALAAERLATAGLRADYVEREGALPAMRGRLLADRQYLERFGLWDSIVCRYDEHELDIPDNQLIAKALRRAAALAVDARVRRRVRNVAEFFNEICDADAFDPAVEPRSMSYTRQNDYYRPAHALCWMILQQQALDSDLTHAEQQGDQPADMVRLRSFLIDMNTLFERFLERVLQDALREAGIHVKAQRSDPIFWRPDTGKAYARVRPDLLVRPRESEDIHLPVDAKYKRYDGGAADVGDLTQAFLYAYAYRATGQSSETPGAILIHPIETPGAPSVTPLEVRSVVERTVDAALVVVGVHIPTILDEVARGEGIGLDRLRSLVLERLPRSPSVKLAA
jgi:5-methylcytosine-specific restriction enzyme subunit McrC